MDINEYILIVCFTISVIKCERKVNILMFNVVRVM